jgi:hypothetical protein
MSWGAQSRFKDAKTPSVGLAMSENPEPDCCPVQPYMRVGAVAVCCSAALLPPVCMRCAPAVSCVHALRACCVCVGPMLIRHVTCASVWACAGQRYFVPRTYPAT